MERLTNKAWRNLDPWECCGQDNYCKRGCFDEGGCNKGCIVPKIYDKLAKYEDAKEHGRLIVLPCKIGDTVYINTPSGATLSEIVDSVTKPQFRTKTVEGLRGLDFEFCDYGKTVFLSREEAEKALEAKEKK